MSALQLNQEVEGADSSGTRIFFICGLKQGTYKSMIVN
jgi:hypothetical protein